MVVVETPKTKCSLYDAIGLGEMDDHEIGRIAAAAHALRPDWPLSSLKTLIGKKLADRPRRDVAVALAWVACESNTATPARVLEPGPWWRAVVVDDPAAGRPQAPRREDQCRRCGGVKPACACTREQLAAVYDDDTTDTKTFRDAKAAAFAAARQARGLLPLTEHAIIHQPGCTWETTPYCDCGADPERTTPTEEDAPEETP